jgi:hypothetical protein
VRLSEPSPEDVERAVETLRLVLELVNHDPVASGMKAVAEVAIGTDISSELTRWLRNPGDKRAVRNEFIRRVREIWSGTHGDTLHRVQSWPLGQR